jgi:hypothetical protein
MDQTYVGVLISLWIFLSIFCRFAAQPKELFLDGLKKLEQRSHKCVELRGNMYSIYIFFSPVACCFLYKAKDLSAPPPSYSIHREKKIHVNFCLKFCEVVILIQLLYFLDVIHRPVFFI